jgi:hypothetical protein
MSVQSLSPTNHRLRCSAAAPPGRSFVCYGLDFSYDQSLARFVVDLLQAARAAVRFFDRTKHHYDRFNYIGEWHSHPSFAVRPSDVDVTAMHRLVSDPSFEGRFAVLMITRLDGDHLTSGAWLFDPAAAEFAIILEQ